MPKAKRHCPQCGGNTLKPLGTAKQSIVYEYVPAHFIAHKHLPDTLVSLRWPRDDRRGPPKWVEKSQYAPSFVASVITRSAPTAFRSIGSRRNSSGLVVHAETPDD